MKKWTVADLFSGAGGASLGFARHGSFEIVGAVDLQRAKPSNGDGTLQCNSTYRRNIGIDPIEADLFTLSPKKLRKLLELKLKGRELDVLISCAPCTGFTRTKATNHLVDDVRNTLVVRSALFVREFEPRVFVMENARELLRGKFTHHFVSLRGELERLGYRVVAKNFLLNEFGLPQSRERAIVLAARNDIELKTIEEIWEGYEVRREATTVRRAIAHLPPLAAGDRSPDDPMHVCPAFQDETTLKRLKALPHDGGDWMTLVKMPGGRDLMTDGMKRIADAGDWGSHPDIYGRAWWDKPSVTIKRECSHVGNGRYSHPEQDRLLSVREIAILQGFPLDFVAVGTMSNMYRHLGDAVPPLISFQIAHVVAWMLSGTKPDPHKLVMPGTHLREKDVVERLTLRRQLEMSLAVGS